MAAIDPYRANPERYEHATFRRCGDHGLVLSPIGIGLWQNCENGALVRDLLACALDHGVTHIDLANNYGPPAGIAEENVGGLLANEFARYRRELVIATKAGWDMWPGPYGNGGSRKYLLSSLDESLQRLRCDYVDIFYHHRPDADVPVAESIGALDQAVRSGKALYAAISNYRGEQIDEAVAEAERLSLPLIVDQVPYSLLRREAGENVAPACARHGIGVVAYSALAQGLLSERYLDGIPENSRAGRGVNRLAERINDDVIALLRGLNAIAQERGQSLAHLALTWLLQQAQVCSILVGASRVTQFEDSLRASQAAPLSDEELQRIAELVEPVAVF